MITAYLIGRLGNAMFQIATCYALANDNSDECVFDLRAFYRYSDNLFKNLKDLPEEWQEKSLYEYTGADFKPIPYKKEMAIIGYFQSDKYFNKYRDDIINLFNIKLSSIENSVSVHVRRGDYLMHQERHLCPAIEYYKRALDYVDSKRSIDKILVFSDDLDWCKENFTDERVIFVDEQDFLCLKMMSACEHNIIANSSFSWWASYLNRNNDKIVIAPEIWVKDRATPDIYRKEMIVL